MPAMSESSELHFSRFAIHETPYCVWEFDLPAKNREFLEQLDPDYFFYQAETHHRNLSKEDPTRQRAAIALRLSYGHALETLFALLGAVIQAPDCPLGYVTLYRPSELQHVIRRIGRMPVLTKLDVPLTWESLAALIFENTLPEGREALEKASARAWARFAADFVDLELTREYNTLKHGLRARFGGFHLKVGIEPSFGVPPPEDEMRTLSGSEFGTASFVMEKVDNLKLHRQVVQVNTNWNPENMVAGVGILVASMHNVIAWLRRFNGERGPMLGRAPEDLIAFELPWRNRPATIRFQTGPDLREEDIDVLTSEEILAVYQNGPRPKPNEQ
jgi:hypothetical protein